MLIESEVEGFSDMVSSSQTETNCYADCPKSCESVSDCRNCCVCKVIAGDVTFIPVCVEEKYCTCIKIIIPSPPPPNAN